MNEKPMIRLYGDMMIRKRIKLLLQFLLISLSAYQLISCLYADISISASVDKDKVVFGESITLQVNVSGDVLNIPNPLLPELADFNVYSSGSSSKSSYSTDGKASSAETHSFILSPNKPGKFTINPITLTVKGKTYSTKPINVEVLPAGSGTAQPQKQVSKQKTEVTDGEKREVFITAELDKKKAFVNEGVTYIFRFFTSRNLYSNPRYSPPNFTGFIVEDLPPQRGYQTSINGRIYNVIEVKTMLFPTSPGVYNLGTASLSVSMRDFSRSPFGNLFDDDFFKDFFSSGKTTIVKSEPITLNVVALPEQGKHGNYSGAVGKYKINTSVDKSKVEANSPVTLTVSISGEGNIKSILEPRFPDIVGIRKYDTVSSVNVSKANYTVTGSKMFKTVIIPERPGDLIIPEVSFSYFDPEKKSYENIESESIQLKVLPSSKPVSAKQPAFSGGISILGQDIRFIKTEPGKKSDGNIRNIASNILLIITPILFLFSFGYNRYNFFVSKNFNLIRSKRAFREFDKKIGNLQKTPVDTRDFYSSVFDLIIKYLSDKSKTVLSGSTFAEIENILIQKNLSSDSIRKIRDILENTDFMRFSPSVDKNVNLKDDAIRIRTVIYNIEKDWKL
ncbi:MAG: protein BatD [Elusimicrobia bacterium]|nr:protein BatD [Elusimicrobiota bacterium]